VIHDPDPKPKVQADLKGIWNPVFRGFPIIRLVKIRYSLGVYAHHKHSTKNVISI